METVCNGGVEDPFDINFRPMNRTTSMQSLSNLSRLSSYSISTDFTRSPSIMGLMEEQIREKGNKKLKSLQVPGLALSPSGSQGDLPTIIHSRSRSLSTAARSRENMADDNRAQIKAEINSKRERETSRQTERDVYTGRTTPTHTTRGRSGVPGRVREETRDTDRLTGSDTSSSAMRGASSMSNVSFIDHKKSNSTPVNVDYILQIPSSSSSNAARQSSGTVILDSKHSNTSGDLVSRGETRSYSSYAISRPMAALIPAPVYLSSSSLPSSLVSSPLSKTVEEKTNSVETLLSTGTDTDSTVFDPDIKFGTKLNLSAVPLKKSGKPAPPVAAKPAIASKSGPVVSGMGSFQRESGGQISYSSFSPAKTNHGNQNLNSEKNLSDNEFKSDREIETMTVSLNDEIRDLGRNTISRGISRSWDNSLSAGSPFKTDQSHSSISGSNSANNRSILNSRISEVSSSWQGGTAPGGDSARMAPSGGGIHPPSVVSESYRSNREVENRTPVSQQAVNDTDKKEERFVASSYINLSPYRSTGVNNNSNCHMTTTSISNREPSNQPSNQPSNRAGSQASNGNNFISNNNNRNMSSTRDSIDSSVSNMNNSISNNSSISSNSSNLNNNNYHMWLDTKRWYSGNRDLDISPRTMRSSHAPSDSVVSESNTSDSGIDRSTIGGHSDPDYANPDLLDDLDSIINPGGSLDEGGGTVGGDEMFEVEMEKISSWKLDGEGGVSHQMASGDTLLDRWGHAVSGKDSNCWTTATTTPSNSISRGPESSSLNVRLDTNATKTAPPKKISPLNGDATYKPNSAIGKTRIEELSSQKARHDFLNVDFNQSKVTPHVVGSARANGNMTFDERRRKFEGISGNTEKFSTDTAEISPRRPNQDLENREKDLALIYGQKGPRNTSVISSLSPVVAKSTVETKITKTPFYDNSLKSISSSQTTSSYSVASPRSSALARGPERSDVIKPLARVEPVFSFSTRAMSGRSIPGDASRVTSAGSIISRLNAGVVDNSKPNFMVSSSTTSIRDNIYGNRQARPAGSLANLGNQSIKQAPPFSSVNVSDRSLKQTTPLSRTVGLDKEDKLRQSTPTGNITSAGVADQTSGQAPPISSSRNLEAAGVTTGFIKKEVDDSLLRRPSGDDKLNVENKRDENSFKQLSIASQSTYVPRVRSRSTNNILETGVNHPSDSTLKSNFSLSTSTLAPPSVDDDTPRHRSLSSSTLLDDDVTRTSPGTSMTSGRASWLKEGQDIEVVLVKGPLGVGFCIEGGIGSPSGDRPITVKRLFKGETPARGLLEEGDEILSVNDQPISGLLSHYSAWNILKNLPDGPAHFNIRRPNV